jgi:transcriptional regulator with XRE-family HTH domain
MSGLMAKDICSLSGVSITSYEQLERGRYANPARPMIKELARALRLNPAETNRLFLLADLSGTSEPRLDPLAVALLGSLKLCPAYYLNPRLDAVAYNRLADSIFDVCGDGTMNSKNQIWRIYTDPQRRRRYENPVEEKAFLLGAPKEKSLGAGRR